MAHSLGGGHDAAMDRYTYILDWLQRGDYARLRAYTPTSGCKFSTWLVVVARRLCLDHRRRHYGQSPSRADAGAERRATRRRLEDLIGERIDLERLSSPRTDLPDWHLRSTELREALNEALASLEPRDRLLLKLRFEFDMPVREISSTIGFPSVFHVYRRINHCLAGLRKDLAMRDVMDSVP